MRLSRVYKDYKLRNNASRIRLYLHVFKFLNSDIRVPAACKGFIMTKLTQKKVNFARSRFASFCFSTARPRGVYTFFNQSRHQLRLHARLGLLTGIRKSSW